MAKYTIQIVQPTGETHDTFGTEYLIKFSEEADSYKLWFKKPPAEGQVVEGKIADGRFKKDKPAFVGIKERSQANSKRLEAQNERSDGMHQGMAINNAVALLIRFAPDLTKLEEVVNYIKPIAQAIYKIDLNATEQVDKVPTDEEVENLDESIEKAFGIPGADNG